MYQQDWGLGWALIPNDPIDSLLVGEGFRGGVICGATVAGGFTWPMPKPLSFPGLSLGLVRRHGGPSTHGCSLNCCASCARGDGTCKREVLVTGIGVCSLTRETGVSQLMVLGYNSMLALRMGK